MERTCDTLQPWFTEKTNCPFNSLRSLQHRACSIVYGTTGMPKVYWKDRVNWTSMLYKGTEINLEHVRNVCENTETEMLHLSEDKVLLGLDLRVDYKDVVEDLTNRDVGYSFLSDRRNEAFQDWTILLKAILDNPAQHARFLHVDHQRKEVVWNTKELKEWLSNYAQLNLLSLLRSEMLGGAPGRATELTAMLKENSETQSAKNVAFLDKYLSIIRMYHKGSNLTGQDKLLPHAVDGFTSDIMVQDLALARPFAEMAIHICYPEDKDLKLMYQQSLFVNHKRLFTTEDLTDIMKKYTLPMIGLGLGVSDWRHISITWKGKLCSEVVALYEGCFEGDTADVLQAGHNRGTEDRIYGLSGDAGLGAAEDLLPKFLKASTKWQTVHKQVPGKKDRLLMILPQSELR